MKPSNHRKRVTLSAEKRAELREVQKRVLGPERSAISARARKAKSALDAARVELARAAELLRLEREGQGLSLSDMQQRSGLGRAAICRLENLVDANPTVGTLDRIAEALGKRLVISLEDRH
jgi:hypothetical protein